MGCFKVLLLSMALVAFPVCNRERRGKYERHASSQKIQKYKKYYKRYFSPVTGRYASQFVPKKLSLAKNKTQNKMKIL